jgi:group I intron endonuclease
MIIYEIKNKINGKSYIGQHSSDELGTYWGSGKLIKRAIKKYGIENFERTILERCSNKKELDEREKYWIREKDSINTGYNLTEGGTGGDTSKFINYSEEWKEGQRNRTKLYWDLLSEEGHKERSIKISGENNGMFGKTHSEETKNKISKAKRGKSHSKEHAEKLKGKVPWNKGLTKLDPRVLASVQKMASTRYST